MQGNNKKFKGHTEINNKHDIKSNFFDILQIGQIITFAWRNIFQGAHKKLWSKIFKAPYTMTRETNLQSIQYKIIHQLITCQIVLFDIKLVDNAKCKYCHEIDNTSIFFLFCPKEDQFWRSFFPWWNN